MEVKELIKAIDETAKSINLYINFNPPVSEEEINELEKTIGEKLPAEIKEFYLTANGQEVNSIRNQKTLENKYEIIDLFFWEYIDSEIGYEWLTLKATLDIWKENNKLLSKSHKGNIDIKDKVKQYWWHEKWLPIAIDIEGNLYYIDLDPGEAGNKYQIIQWWHDSEDIYIVAKNITELFTERLDILKNIQKQKFQANNNE